MSIYLSAFLRKSTDDGGRPSLGAIRVLRGRVHVTDRPLSKGAGTMTRSETLMTGESGAEWVDFRLTSERPAQTGAVLCCEKLDPLMGPHLLRLDEVSFPPGATAYRHTHPGPGIRYLVSGKLTLHADDHSFIATPGTAWFEPANSPVRAVADETAPETRFVRFMVLPPQFLGKPTINILDPSDRDLPKLQTTTRHFDEIVQTLP